MGNTTTNPILEGDLETAIFIYGIFVHVWSR
jgi:hypothetical protein